MRFFKRKMDWVVDIEKELREEKTSMVVTDEQKRSIYHVSDSTKDLHKNSFTPLTVSFGPYHCQQKELNMQMDAHKRRALIHFCRNSGKPLQKFVTELQPVVQRLMESYESLAATWNPDTFLKLMLLDGCFMLEILRAYKQCKVPGSTYGNFGIENDPIFSYHGKIYVMPQIRRDMLMLENQIPMEILVRLVKVEGTANDAEDAELLLNKLILKFMNPTNRILKESNIQSSLHILDLYRTSLLGRERNKLAPFHPSLVQPPQNQPQPSQNQPPRNKPQKIVRSAEMLHEAGIGFRASKTSGLLDVSFAGGVLRLPSLVVDDTTELAFLNLMMFERLHLGIGYDVTSFVVFMNNILDSADDVSLLQSYGIFYTDAGSDNAIPDLFHGISKDVILVPNCIHDTINRELNYYCDKEYNKRMANIRRSYIWRTYFRHPWAFVSLLAATFIMILTVAQTIYSIVSYHAPNEK